MALFPSDFLSSNLLLGSSDEDVRKFIHFSGVARLLVLHDALGNIIDIPTGSSWYFESVRTEFLAAKSLAAFFDINGPLPENGTTRLFQARPFRFAPGPIKFCTSLPQTDLWIHPLGGGRFLSSLAYLDLVPLTTGLSHYTFILTDHLRQTMVGFMKEFHGLFRSEYDLPEKMLGRPLSDFFSPSPGEFQNLVAPAITRAGLEDFPLLFEERFTGGLSDAWEARPGPARLETIGSDGCLWQNRSGELQYLTLLRGIDTERADFSASLSFEPLEGGGPLVIFGDRYDTVDNIPDTEGYALCPPPAGSDSVLLKRNGYLMEAVQVDAAPERGTGDFCAAKVRDSLFLFKGRQMLLNCHDTAFLHKRSLFITLALRPGESCRLRGFYVRMRPLLGPGEPRQTRHIIRLTGGSREYFMLDRIYYPLFFKPHFTRYAGYVLTDITDLQEKIESQDSRFRVQRKREERLKRLLRRYEGTEDEFVSKSRPLEAVKETARTLAASDATVLIEGPTGSGKEVLARYIHSLSPRREGPFVKMDCSTVPAALFESALFGHEKGAFTGATAGKEGLLHSADSGTLFLDEAGNLTPDAQAKLLQFLNDFTYRRVGGTGTLKADVRCVVASNVPLLERVKQGLFREDLYYRINVVSLKLPPLTDRREDIPLLAARFLEQFSREHNRPGLRFSEEAMARMAGHSWPGNVRELKNVIQQAVLLCRSGTLGPDDLKFEEAPVAAGVRGRRKSPCLLAHTDKKEVVAVLKKRLGRVADAARDLGMSRPALYKFMALNSMDVRTYRTGFRAGRRETT